MVESRFNKMMLYGVAEMGPDQGQRSGGQPWKKWLNNVRDREDCEVEGMTLAQPIREAHSFSDSDSQRSPQNTVEINMQAVHASNCLARILSLVSQCPNLHTLLQEMTIN